MKNKTFQQYKKYILEIAKIKYKEKRKRKYSLDYYLSKMIMVLKDITKWEVLKYNCESKNQFHWKTIYNEFVKWSNDDIFNIAFNKFVSENYFKIKKIKKNQQINLFVDVTKINNKKGCEAISVNYENKKKNVTNIMCICDENKLPLGINYLKQSKKYPNGKKSVTHEILGLQETLNNISINIKNPINIIGDKAYISSKDFFYNNKKVILVSPKRRNQKNKNTKKEKKLLKSRNKIENLFSDLKVYNRIDKRMETKIHHYLSFFYLGMLEYYFKYLEKHFSHLL
jgi:hypothetical protein